MNKPTAWMVYSHPETPGYFTTSADHVSAIRAIPGAVIVPMVPGEPEVIPPQGPRPMGKVVMIPNAYRRPATDGGGWVSTVVVELTTLRYPEIGDDVYLLHRE